MNSVYIYSYPITIAFERPLYNLYDTINSVGTYDVHVNIIKEDFREYPKIDMIVESSITIPFQKNPLKKIGAMIRRNTFTCNILLKKQKRGDVAIFFMEHGAIIPCALAKILGITSMKLMPSSIAHNRCKELSDPSSCIIYGIQIFENLWFDKIGIYGSNLIADWNLHHLYNKLIIVSEHVVDIELFKMEIDYSLRPKRIAYIGRFSREKGVFNFLNSIPQIISCNEDVEIVIIGDGELKGEVTNYVENKYPCAHIRLLPWVEHSMLPTIMNSLKLVVIPSHTEGLPNVLLEAMACGTPAVVSPVGVIPSFIMDKENGYVLRDNSPSSIASTITMALQDDKIGTVSKNARKTIERCFTKEVVKMKWMRVMDTLRGKQLST